MIRVLWIFVFALPSLWGAPLLEQFQQKGYVEVCNKRQPEATFEALYARFDELIAFFEKNPAWIKKLYSAKERFIRSKDRKLYSTDFFGLYDESKREGRSQVSFYYSIHFHEFISSHYPELNKIPELNRFLQVCLEIEQPYADLFKKAATELGLTIFSSSYGYPPILFKVVKYLPYYTVTRPHYDGTAFSLFLHSTDNESLLLCSYKPSFTRSDFSSPLRECKDSILLIPGMLLTEFSIYPTPHMAAQSGKTRYATIAFAMRPSYISQKIELSPLPDFKD